MYEYLTKKFGNVTVLSNGLLYAKDSAGNEIYVRPDCTSTDLFAYYPGRGGSSVDASVIRKQMRSSNPPDYAVIIASKATTSTNILQKATDIMNDNNVSINNIAVQTFSLSGGIGFEKVGAFISNNPQYSDRCVLFVADGFDIKKYTSRKGSKALADAGVPIVIIETAGGDGSKAKRLSKSGYNAYLLELPLVKHNYINWHQYTNSDPIARGLPQYVLGLSETEPQKYSICKYVDGQKVSASLSSLLLEFGNGNDSSIGKESQIVFADYKPDMSVQTNMVSNDNSASVYYTWATEWYKDLKNLNSLNISNIPDAFYTNISYVLEQANNIRNAIKNSDFLNSTTITFGGGDGIPGCFAKYVNMYYNLVGKLMESLAAETNSIASVAKLVMDMDINLEGSTPNEPINGSIIELSSSPSTETNQET